jgi:hypothetical protein
MKPVLLIPFLVLGLTAVGIAAPPPTGAPPPNNGETEKPCKRFELTVNTGLTDDDIDDLQASLQKIIDVIRKECKGPPKSFRQLPDDSKT